ncbi:LppU/SCO3897 family protein [Saccharomonospora xinjiangensis]|uniref:Uncharacterized protein n=1 Tax=Saccharomonospora xinjiangensis XJ-54 TaxID=882086 RepID=I0V4W3_9PSEU|nr:hypothetical protein [Saccharomonospora xinjiangensis]EID55166.1 hypothetical protein SacxiDRAFT_2954 [Saccharomonospora xinjiangensis XJ-54]
MSVPPGSGPQPGDFHSGSAYGQPQYGQQQPGAGGPVFGEQQWGEPRYGELPTAPPMPLPPVPPKKLKAGAVVATVVVALAVVAGAVALVVMPRPSGTTADGGNVAVGHCVAVKGSDDLAVARSVDCSDPKALWRVAANLSSTSSPCPDGDYDEYHYNTGTKLCLVLNVEAGDCLSNLDGEMSAISKVTCTASEAELMILRVEEGATDVDGVCGMLGDALGGAYYSEPARVLCFGQPQAV